jgi:hypothetical protein
MNIANTLRQSACALVILLGTAGHSLAANVAFWSDQASLADFPALTAAHTVTAISSADIDAGALSAYDALVVGHVMINTATTCTEIANFLAAGKGVVGEWNAATVLFQPAAGAFLPVPVPCNLLAGNAEGGSADFGTDVPIQITNPASPLVAGLSNPFSMEGGSEFVYRLTGLGSNWNVAATFDGAGTTYPAVLSTTQAGGCVALSPFDYFDAASSGSTARSNMETLLNNMVAVVLAGSSVCGKAAAPVAAAVPVPTMATPWLAVLAGLLGGLAWLRRRRQV